MQLFGISQYGKSLNATAQNRLNCYMEVQPGDDRSRVVHYGTPGLSLFVSFGDTPSRGLHQKGDYLYVVHRGTLYEVNNAGVKTAKGTINTTSGRVYMADNGKQLMLTDGEEGWIYTFNNPTPKTLTSITFSGTTATATTDEAHELVSGTEITVSGATEAAYNGTFRVTVTGTTTYTYTMLSTPSADASVVGSYAVSQFAQIVDENFPTAATATWLDGYFICNPSTEGLKKRFYISAIDNGYIWDALDFASAEANPDDITLVTTDNSTLYLLGELTTEFWVNTGALDFPFSRISGGSIEWGCASRDSVVKFDNSLAFLAKNRMGEVIIARMDGYLPQKISTPEIEHIINNYTDVADAKFYSYMLGGHPMLQCNFNTGGESWLYDGLTAAWSKLQSHNITRHRGDMSVNYLNRAVVADYGNGSIYRLDSDVYTDNGDPIAFEVTSRHLYFDDSRAIIDSVKIDVESGVGLVSGQGFEPQIMMQVSKDGGHTWGNERWRSLGKIGEYLERAVWRRLGMARQFTFKFRITDPVKRVVLGAVIKSRVGR